MKRKEAATGAQPEATQTFESMMGRLEELVTRLEGGNLSLEESIRSFEEGIGLVRRCTEVLTEAEQRIQRLQRDAGQVPKISPLELPQEDAPARDDELPF